MTDTFWSKVAVGGGDDCWQRDNSRKRRAMARLDGDSHDSAVAESPRSMMTQDKETLQEALKRLHLNGFWDGASVMFPEGKDREESFAKYDGILSDIDAIIQQRIDAAIATMFERLRTPSEGMIEAGGERFGDVFSDMPLDCEDDRQGALKIWQAMLTAFQQENSDGR